MSIPTPRPTRHDPEIIAAVAAELTQQVIEWLPATSEANPDEITESLKKAIRFETDGYRIARHMDDYDPDADLVEILDNTGHLLRKHWEAACTRWVEQTGIQAPAIGSQVTHPRYPGETGTVVRHYPEGCSTVSFPSLGHVSEGVGCHRFILYWEHLSPAPQPDAPP